MNVKELLSFIAFIFYIYIGVYSFLNIKKNIESLLFLIICISLAFWSFGYVYAYGNVVHSDFWTRFSAVGWIFFSVSTLHLILRFIDNKIFNKVPAQFLLYVPAIIIFYMRVIIWGEIQTSQGLHRFYGLYDIVYNIGYLTIALILVALWSLKQTSTRERSQGRLILITGALSFLLNLIGAISVNTIHLKLFPAIGQVYAIPMILGIYYSILKFQFLKISPNIILDEVLAEMMDVFFLLSPEGKVTKINNRTADIVGTSKGKILNRHIANFFKERDAILSLVDVSNTPERMLEEVNLIDKNSALRPMQISVSRISDDITKEIIGIVIIGHDITVKKQLEKQVIKHEEMQQKLIQLAYHDSLTGLANRKHFVERFEEEISKQNISIKKLGVIFADLNDFKRVNDTYGHEAGDYLLCQVGDRLKKALSEKSLIARLGGDEFAILVYDVLSFEDLNKVMNNISQIFIEPVIKDNISLKISASLGASIFPEEGITVDELINRADKEMYKMKKQKKLALK
jgi:diguanylate cyclase (GGDEF)-like protein/PAS domain S-box-containing protein